jgi:hypothetical protein
VAVGKCVQTFTAACSNIRIYQTSWRHISQAVLVTPVRTSDLSWIQTDEMNLSLFASIALFLTLCFLPSFVFFCFPSPLSSHIHQFIVAEQWVGSSPSRPPHPQDIFSPFNFLCLQPTSGRTSWPPTIWLQNPDLWKFRLTFLFSLTNLWV